MKRAIIASIVAMLMCIAPMFAGDPHGGFESLFNGKDLAGWKATGNMNVWGADVGRPGEYELRNSYVRVRRPLLSFPFFPRYEVAAVETKVQTKPMEPPVIFCDKGGGGWLMTEKEFGDFELRLEYKMPKGGNSGVGIRSPLKGDPAYVGMEIQLIDDEGWPGGLQKWQNTGAIYNVVPPKTIKNKTIGEWNEMKIIAKGRQITIINNGETLVDANLDDYVKEHGKKHPGILDTNKKGHIGFQSYNKRVEFRNIYLKAL